MEDLLYVKDYYLPVFSAEKPENKSDVEWTLLHRQVCGYIRQWVDDNVLNHISGETHACSLWSKLEQLYARQTGNNKLFLIKQMMALRYQDGTPLSDHLNTWSETIRLMISVVAQNRWKLYQLDVKSTLLKMILGMQKFGESSLKGDVESKLNSPHYQKNLEAARRCKKQRYTRTQKLQENQESTRSHEKLLEAATTIHRPWKCSNPSSVNDYRPISCCNTIHKCIAKLLASKLQLTLPHIIDTTQTAFVQGRKITDSILLAHELLRGYHKDIGPPRCAIKIELMKAFDSVNWDFISNCLTLLKFPQKFISLILSCISSPSFTIALNGEFQGFFKGKRGLRQGDPISPFLFVIVIEALSSIISNYVTRAPRFKHHWRCKEQRITHLSFVDDLLLLCHGDIESISILKSALDLFYSMSGLTINLSKSSIFCAGIHPQMEEVIIDMFGIQKGGLPIRHLGVPLITTNLKSSDCRTLIERITHRISHWSARSLSYAGHLQLLKAVLVSTQLYWSSIFVLRKSVINELNKIFRSFLWSGPELKSTGSKVTWYNVCRPKAEGGLDIPNLEVANRAAILRYIWDLHTDNSDRVWINWCRIYLIKNRSFWSLKIPQPCSWSWRKILQLRHPARLIIKHVIDNGMDTNFWLDNWSPAGPLSLCFPSHILSNLGADEFTLVGRFIVNNSWSFPHSLSNAVPELLALPQPCSTRKDKLIWSASPSGTFNLKHTTLHLAGNGDQIAWNNLVWCSLTIPRMKFNMWFAAQSRLPTLDSRAMASHDSICALCNSEPESHSHLFFRCIFSSPLWKFIQDRCKFYKPFLSWEDMILWISHRWKGSSPINMLQKICLSAMVYHIWEERNNRIFKGKSSSQRLVLTKVSNTITSLLQLRCLKDCEASRCILQPWNLSLACCRPPPRPPD
ncbi:uncharacterized protein LOC132301202 [Cornus florida]|uniref:uncharacterized protein LOC132301202 n=1 Tax=Cornus florida TaxID=4283 RepID=UPI00289EF45D|nr:uncharacterized protein LOC132301202 [Cornus florida]